MRIMPTKRKHLTKKKRRTKNKQDLKKQKTKTKHTSVVNKKFREKINDK